MADDKRESLKLIIEEQRRDYDYLLHIYNRTRATENVLLTAAFGIVGYLYYSTPQDGKLSIAQRLSVPTEDYGKVICFMALSFFVYGVFKLMFTVFGDNPWETAYEASKTNYSHRGTDSLFYVKKRYDACYQSNSQQYGERKKNLIFLFYCILISATILIVIKTLK